MTVLRLAVPASPMGAAELASLRDAVRRADLDADVSALLLAGGATFGGPVADDDEGTAAFVDLLLALRETPKPVLALVEGDAAAEGATLAAAADLILATATAQFRPVPGAGDAPPIGTTLFVRRIGEGRTLALLLTGGALDAVQAQQVGLVAGVAPGGTGDVVLGAVLAELQRRGPTALGLAKRTVGDPADTALLEALARERRVRALASLDRQRGGPAGA